MDVRVVVTGEDMVQGVLDAGFLLKFTAGTYDEGLVLIGCVYSAEVIAAIKAAPGFMSIKPDALPAGRTEIPKPIKPKEG